MRRFLICVAVAIGVVTGILFLASLPGITLSSSGLPENARFSAKALPRPNPANLTVLGITLGHANLASVRARLGPAKVWSSGDASTAEHKVCYVTRGPRQVVVIFASNWEMAGPPENDVTDIRIIRSVDYQNRSKCGSLAISGDEVTTKNGLKLGLNRQTVRTISGQPKRATGSKWDYASSLNRPLPTSDKYYSYYMARKDECFEGQSPFFTVNSAITVRFDNGLVIGLSLSRIETIC